MNIWLSSRSLVPEPGEHDLPEIGDAVAIPILQIHEIRLEADVDAAVVGNHRRGIAQPVGEDRALVEAAVAIEVLEQPDPPMRSSNIRSVRVSD